MSRLLYIFAFWIIATALQAQQISGKVTDFRGDPLPGVTIQYAGTSIGTISDMNGDYKILRQREILKFSYVGFVTQDIAITDEIVVLVSTPTRAFPN